MEYVSGNNRNRYRLTLAAQDVPSQATLIQELAAQARDRRVKSLIQNQTGVKIAA